MSASARKSFDAAARMRLARLLGMLGSAHDGEALNAARLADRLVKAAGMTWNDILVGGGRFALKRKSPCKPRRGAPTTRARADATTWEEAAQQVLACGRASPWEVSFCENLLAIWRGRRLSEKQAAVLATIWRERYARDAA